MNGANPVPTLKELNTRVFTGITEKLAKSSERTPEQILRAYIFFLETVMEDFISHWETAYCTDDFKGFPTLMELLNIEPDRVLYAQRILSSLNFSLEELQDGKSLEYVIENLGLPITQ